MKQKERRRRRQALIKAVAQKLQGKTAYMTAWELMKRYADWMPGDAVFSPDGLIIYEENTGKEIARWRKPPASPRSSRK